MGTPRGLRSEEARSKFGPNVPSSNQGRIRTEAAPAQRGEADCAPHSLGVPVPVEPTAGTKGADPGRPAGTTYLDPRDERDPAPGQVGAFKRRM